MKLEKLAIMVLKSPAFSGLAKSVFMILIAPEAKDGCTPADIATELEVDIKSIRCAINELSRANLVIKNRKQKNAGNPFLGKSLLHNLEAVLPRRTGETDNEYVIRAMRNSNLPKVLSDISKHTTRRKSKKK